MPDPVIIVGAGVAGLAAARHLQQGGLAPLVLEASDRPGGRVRTDVVDGFRLDRGFQVLLTAYPEARALLDLEALRLRPFYPGALVRTGGAFHRVADPWRRPFDALGALGAPVGSLGDKLRIAALRHRAREGSLADLWRRPDAPTLDRLRELGFSAAMIETFLRPFLGGIFLERELETSSRMLEFVIRMMAEGATAVPADGMEAIPRQLAAALPAGALRTHTEVREVSPDGVTLATGERLGARAVIVATEEESASRLTAGRVPYRPGRTVANLYFDAPRAPCPGPYLILNGGSRGMIDNMHTASEVAPEMAPPGRALVSVTLLGHHDLADEALTQAVREEARSWFGAEVDRWRHLRTYRIADALPARPAGTLGGSEPSVVLPNGVYVAGDHRTNGSIDGALRSGRLAAEAVHTTLVQRGAA